jgi:SM-20-related protein
VSRAIATRGYAIREGFVDAGAAAAWAEEARASFREGEFHQAGIGRGEKRRLRPEERGDFTRWLDPPGASACERRYFELMEELRRALNRDLTLGLFDVEAHLALYPPGARYRCHLDRFEGEGSRIVSVVLYLNPGWSADDRGSLRLYLEKPESAPFVDVLPQAGTLACFLSDRFHHEVLPARRERLAATGWFRRRPAQPTP